MSKLSKSKHIQALRAPENILGNSEYISDVLEINFPDVQKREKGFFESSRQGRQ